MPLMVCSVAASSSDRPVSPLTARWLPSGLKAVAPNARGARGAAAETVRSSAVEPMASSRQSRTASGWPPRPVSTSEPPSGLKTTALAPCPRATLAATRMPAASSSQTFAPPGPGVLNATMLPSRLSTALPSPGLTRPDGPGTSARLITGLDRGEAGACASRDPAWRPVFPLARNSSGNTAPAARGPAGRADSRWRRSAR
jgi:hypothetical protein